MPYLFNERFKRNPNEGVPFSQTYDGVPGDSDNNSRELISVKLFNYEKYNLQLKISGI